MTCIVGLKDKGKVYIGGDSLGTNSAFQRTVRADEKVFIKNDMVFGFTSSFRMGQILRYTFEIPERIEGITDMEYLVRFFIPDLIDCFEQHKFLKKTDEDGGAAEGGQFLLGYRGNLYNIESDFQVGIPVLEYDACGCGEDLAKGSLHTSENVDKKISAEKRITLALDAATLHSAGVAGPYVILNV